MAPGGRRPGVTLVMKDFIPLPGGNWHTWQAVVLRSAGFPCDRVEALADPDLARAAGSLDAGLEAAFDAAFDTAFDTAAARLSAVIRDIAADPWFREAITWQNARFVATCLDRGTTAGSRRDSRIRGRETAIASYLQRYTTKNESIGFFGPVGWASWRAAEAASAVVPGPGLTGRRTVYFESWAIEVLSAAMAEREGLMAGIPPRRNPANLHAGDHVRLPNGRRIPVTGAEAAVLELCDGLRTVHDIAGAVGRDTTEVLGTLRDLDSRALVRLDFGASLGSQAIGRLLDRLSRVPDRRARRAALADLGCLTAAKDEVAAAAGDPKRLAVALDALDDEFRSLTGRPPSRRAGQTYAARTIVYEDTVRDVEVSLGADVLRALGEPLSLILDSARWLAARIAGGYARRLAEHVERRCERTGQETMPLGVLLALATRDFYTGRGLPPLVQDAVAELQRRWAGILDIPASARRHEVSVEHIAGRVREVFGCAPPPWPAGRAHSPDVMIAADSVEAINRGDFLLVLGELHLASNTVRSRALVDQSPDPERLAAMAETAAGAGQIVAVMPREWGITTRTAPALASPRDAYWTMGGDDVSDLPASPIPAAALEVIRTAAGPLVRSTADGTTYPLAEVLGEYLSMTAVNAFRLLPRDRRHTPRVTIGRLVVARESWRLPPRKCEWARHSDERRRYLEMRRWVARHGLPRRVFCSVATETKPVYVDFTSLPLTNGLASLIRRQAQGGSGADVVFTEMLPDPGNFWLRDGDGRSYAAELRMVVAEHAG